MNWLKWRWLFYIFSIVMLLISTIGIAAGGLKPALEFTGGAELIISTDQPDKVASVIESTTTEQELSYTQTVQQQDRLYLSFRELSEPQKQLLLQTLQQKTQAVIELVRFQNVGPAISSDLIKKTAYAVVLGVVTILIYIWWQFKNWRYGLAAILAMLHDSFILLGGFAWLGYLHGVQVDLLFVTALLTTLSFSVHDTIVVFDRLRELKVITRDGDNNKRVSNLAITQTLSRSINNSLTILLMLATLLLLGGESLRWFSTALFIGTLTGTYSSTFTAMPIHFDLQKRFKN